MANDHDQYNDEVTERAEFDDAAFDVDAFPEANDDYDDAVDPSEPNDAEDGDGLSTMNKIVRLALVFGILICVAIFFGYFTFFGGRSGKNHSQVAQRPAVSQPQVQPASQAQVQPAAQPKMQAPIAKDVELARIKAANELLRQQIELQKQAAAARQMAQPPMGQAPMPSAPVAMQPTAPVPPAQPMPATATTTAPAMTTASQAANVVKLAPSEQTSAAIIGELKALKEDMQNVTAVCNDMRTPPLQATAMSEEDKVTIKDLKATQKFLADDNKKLREKNTFLRQSERKYRHMAEELKKKIVKLEAQVAEAKPVIDEDALLPRSSKGPALPRGWRILGMCPEFVTLENRTLQTSKLLHIGDEIEGVKILGINMAKGLLITDRGVARANL